MSGRAAAYQSRISGLGEGLIYLVNGVKFDGFVGGVLVDAKGPGYATFVKGGEFVEWFLGTGGLLSQAKRQLAAARGVAIEWHFAEESAAVATRGLLEEHACSA